jgi:hypothetical protein
MIDFPHSAPNQMHYEYEEFRSNVTAIWIAYDRVFDYNLGKSVRSIWGFYHSKTKTYFSPVNSKTPGKAIRIEDTSPYSAMPLKQTPLTAAFV